jgi:DNA-binding protein H-NS
MAKLTVTEIKKQIAALEAKAARLAEEETKASVAKVRALMNQLGVTLEHLSSMASKKASAVKKAIVGKKRGTPKRASKGAPRYRDPKTGATWSGFGRAPGWIAGATNREAFLVDHSGSKSTEKSAKAPATKKSAAKKASPRRVAQPAAKKATAVAKTYSRQAAPGAATKSSAKKAAPKATAKKRAKASSAMAAPNAPEGGASSAV